jgi:DNA-binding MarR family transcriptional regulator
MNEDSSSFARVRSLAQSGTNRQENEDSTIVLGILQAIDGGERITQRAVASELGIALGLVNAYVKRCMKKGLIKMRAAPARRYAYYLTPKGFSEKSRLTASYLAHSFSFFRRARADCELVLAKAIERRMKRVALVGASDLAEIVALCVAEQPLQIIAVVDRMARGRYKGIPVVASFAELDGVDGLIVTDLADPHAAYDAAVAVMGADRVLAPAMLRTGHEQSARSSALLRKVAS